MPTIVRVTSADGGRWAFAIAVAGLALLCLIYGDFAPVWAPGPASQSWPRGGTYVLGALLLAAAVGLLWRRTASLAVVFVAAYGLAWFMARARFVVLQPQVVGSWYGVGEAVGPLMGAWLLSVRLRADRERTTTPTSGLLAVQVARVLFGTACVSYGAAHFAYPELTGAMVPEWFSGRSALVFVTGAAHVAAGCGLILGIVPRLAATLEATMMGLFGLLVWLPRLVDRHAPDWAPTAQVQWSETFLTLLLFASAWLVADSLRTYPWGFRPRSKAVASDTLG